jgi:DNA-binding GntR family transcriptional regulator
LEELQDDQPQNRFSRRSEHQVERPDEKVKMKTKLVKNPKKKGSGEPARQESRADQVYDRILQAVRSGRYQPGERLREAEVASWLEVSRTPVREALRRLESDGLLTFESWRGVVVSDLNRQQISELYAMREVLEGAAARMAARHIDEAEIELLGLLMEQSEAAVDDSQRLAKLNRKLHQTIYAAAHNQYLSQTLKQQENAIALLRGTTFELPGRAETAASEHRAIVNAICNRDADAAESTARIHIANAQRARLRLILENEE